MRLKSPTDQIMTVALLSGHAISIGPEGRDVPQMYIAAAFEAGAVPADGTKVSSAPPKPTNKTPEEMIVAGVEKYLASSKPLTGAGLPDLGELSKMVGFTVTAVQLEAAMVVINKKYEDNGADPFPEPPIDFDAKDTTKAMLQDYLNEQQVEYETDANKPTLVALCHKTYNEAKAKYEADQAGKD